MAGEDGGGFSPEAFLSRIGETFSGVKFGRGVGARTTQAMIGLLVVWAIVAWRWSENLVADSGLLVVGVCASLVFLIWSRSIQKFAEKNPAQAMLEGAEFLEYAKFEAQAKGLPPSKDSPLIEDKGGRV